MPTADGPQGPRPATTHLVGIHFLFRNNLPDVLADLYEGRPAADHEFIAEIQAAANTEELYLIRTVALPGIPRVGELVEVNGNWPPARVLEVEWRIDVEPDAPQVEVLVEDIDEDHVGPGSLLQLLEAGWQPDLGRL